MTQLDRIEKLLGDVLTEIREHRHDVWKWKFNAAMDQLDDAIARQRLSDDAPAADNQAVAGRIPPVD